MYKTGLADFEFTLLLWTTLCTVIRMFQTGFGPSDLGNWSCPNTYPSPQKLMGSKINQ